jgi:hypothetical protein
MMAVLSGQVAPWFAVVLIGLCAALSIGVLTARSLFAMVMRLAALAAVGAAALLALGQGEAALTLALVGAGVAPTLLFGGILLSARAAKPRKHKPWFSLIAVAVCAGALLWAARDLAVAPPPVIGAGPVVLWLGVLVLVSAAGCAALLGYGERGVLERANSDTNV